MNVYIFQAALYCEACGRDLCEGTAPSENSDKYPQGPYPDGGGEADCPQHCDACGVFLENPLTKDGEHYVLEQIAMSMLKRKPTDVVEEWRKFYDYLDTDK